MSLRVGSLFAGVGGFDMGFEDAGFEIAWQVEIDNDAVSVLQRHYPGVPRYGDVQAVTALPGLCKRHGSGLQHSEALLNGRLGVGEPMAIWTKHDAVLQPVLTARILGDDMVGIARGFGPTAAHTSVTMPAANSLHPGRLVSVDRPLGDDVGAPFVPGFKGTNEVQSLSRGSAPRVSPQAGLMSGDPEMWPASPVTGRQCSATSTPTKDFFHEEIISHSLPLMEAVCSHLAPVDVIIGGFPCQDLSVAGKRSGLAGKRSGLFWEAIRIVREMREATNGRYPAIVVFENVPGLLSSGVTPANPGGDFALVLQGLSELGAAVTWRILDARFFGVPQRRRRVFIVADFAELDLGERRAAQILSLFKGGVGDSAAGRAQGEGASGGAEDGAAGFSESGPGWWRDGIRTLRAEGENRPSRPSSVVAVANSVTASAGHHGHSSPRGDGSDNLVVQGGSQQDQFCSPEGIAPTLAHASNTHGGHYQPKIVLPVAFQESQSGIRDGETFATLDSNYGSRRHNGVAVAISENQRAEVREAPYAHQITAGGGKPGQGYPSIREGMAVRRLTPREAERLMGWPDDHTRWRADGSEIPDGPRYRMIGNGVVAPVAAWIAHRLRGELEAS